MTAIRVAINRIIYPIGFALQKHLLLHVIALVIAHGYLFPFRIILIALSCYLDVNECKQNPNVCKAGYECRNVIGSYQCIRQVPCGFGYILNPETQECEGILVFQIHQNNPFP